MIQSANTQSFRHSSFVLASVAMGFKGPIKTGLIFGFPFIMEGKNLCHHPQIDINTTLVGGLNPSEKY